MNSLVGWGLSNAVWATLAAVLAEILTRRYRAPAFAHVLWLLVLLKLLAPPFVSIAVPWPEPVQPSEIAVPAEFDAAPITPEPIVAASWLGLMPLLWLGGSLLCLGWVTLHALRFRRVLGRVRPAPPALQEEVHSLARRVGLQWGPKVLLVPGAVSPMIWCLGTKPRLLLPTRLLDLLDRDQRTAILLHELAHLRRRDHWVRWVELAALVLYWWHPVVWWVRRRLRDAEEQCCDAWVVWALNGQGRSYALALLQTVAFFSQARPALPVTASGIGHVPLLRRRLSMIMQANTPRSLSWGALLGLLGLGLLVLAPGTPILADPPKDKLTDKELHEQLKKLHDEQNQINAELKKREADKQAKVNSEVKEAQEAVHKARAQLKAAEEKLNKALQKSGLVVHFTTAPTTPMFPSTFSSNAFQNVLLQPYPLQNVTGVVNGAKGYWAIAKPTGPPRSNEQRLKDVERKLEELQKTVDGLKKSKP